MCWRRRRKATRRLGSRGPVSYQDEEACERRGLSAKCVHDWRGRGSDRSGLE